MNKRLQESIMLEINSDFEAQFGDQIREFIIDWADAAFQTRDFADMNSEKFMEAVKTSICGAIQSISEEEIFADDYS